MRTLRPGLGRVFTVFIPTAAQLAAVLHSTARHLAPVLAFAIAMTEALIRLASRSGHAARRALHGASDQLAARWRRPCAVAAAPALPHPLVQLASELEALSCAQLRALTGCRRKLSKRQLIAQALAC